MSSSSTKEDQKRGEQKKWEQETEDIPIAYLNSIFDESLSDEKLESAFAVQENIDALEDALRQYLPLEGWSVSHCAILMGPNPTNKTARMAKCWEHWRSRIQKLRDKKAEFEMKVHGKVKEESKAEKKEREAREKKIEAQIKTNQEVQNVINRMFGGRVAIIPEMSKPTLMQKRA